MPRPSFTVSLPGWRTTRSDSNVNGYTVLEPAAKETYELVGGTTRRKPKGWVPPLGYSLDRREIVRQVGTNSYGIVANNWTIHTGSIGTGGAFNGLNHFDGSGMSEATANSPLNSSAALVAARNKLKASKVNLGVAYAERKKTARMIGDNASRIALAVRETRNGNFRNAARALGITHDVGRPRGSNWTDHWLQLQYGAKPFMSDVYGSCDALAKRERSDWRVTTKAQRKDTFKSEFRSTIPGTSYPTGAYDAYHCVAERKRGVFVRIDAIPDNDLTMSLASLGVTNPLLVAWELVPYSFVLDWFIPVGAWLNSIDATLGYTSMYTSTTFHNETLWEDRGVSRTFPSKFAYVKNNWYGSKRLLRVSRSASSGVPLPSLPRFKDPRSLGHMANGLSLLASAFGRR